MIKLEKTEFLIADQKLCEFNKEHEQFWDILFKDNSPNHPIENARVNYSNFGNLKPNIWGGEIIYDDDGAFCNFELRQIGTTLAELYGQEKGQYLIDNYSENSFRNQYPTYHYRLTRLIEEILDKRKPILSINHYLENNKNEIRAAGLTIPITNDGKNIHTIISYVDISLNQLKNVAI